MDLNRMLGSTAGPSAGRVRALLALGLTVAYVLAWIFLAAMWLVFGRDEAKDLVLAGWGALGTAFTLVTGLYLGARGAETGSGRR